MIISWEKHGLRVVIQVVSSVGPNSESRKEAGFPEKVYTVEEVRSAQRALSKGHRHMIKIVGSDPFTEKVEGALGLIRAAGYKDFLRKYIRSVVEIDGVSQLREHDAAIWANIHNFTDPVEGARFLIQKAHQMKMYLEGKPYYEHGETSAIQRSLEFLEELKVRCKDRGLREKCEETLRLWRGYGPM